MVDWQSELLAPAYDTLAVDVVLYREDGYPPLTLRAIDKTSGVEMQERNSMVYSVVPVAAFLLSELTAAGLEPHDLAGGTLEMNGLTWRIENRQMRPSPAHAAETVGQLYAVLTQVK
jgi:hypothetical protein